MTRYYAIPFADSGDKASIPDAAQPSGSVSFTLGYTSDYQLNLATDPAAKAFPRNQNNQFCYDVTENLQAFQQYGVPLFIPSMSNAPPTFAYAKGVRVRYDDGHGEQMYESLTPDNTSLPTDTDKWSVVDPTKPILVPGLLFDYAGDAVPEGFLKCDGAAVSRITYAALFTAISTLWGAGDGVTTFNLPNFQRRVAVGSGGNASALLGNAVGDLGGSETHTLTTAEMPSHTHSMGRVCGGSGGLQFSGGSGMADISPNTGSSGSSQPHTIVQPSAIVAKIIKY